MLTSANNVLCLLMLARRWSRIALTLSEGILPPGCPKTSVRQYLTLNIGGGGTGCRIIMDI